MSGSQKGWLFFLILAGLGTLAALPYGVENGAHILALKAKFSGDAQQLARARAALAQEAGGNCRQSWLLAQVADPGDEQPYQDAMKCSLEYVSLAAFQQATDITLAQHAVDLYPGNFSALFWLGNAQAAAKQAQALVTYRKILEIDPGNSKAWFQIGLFHTSLNQTPQALEAFIQTCNTGDHDTNGCAYAGDIEEKMGHLQSAYNLYHRSRWSEAQKRAAELQKTLQP